MDPSYNNPLGGQFSPTEYPPQGDIILTPTPGNKQLNWKRILILIGGVLIVVILFVIVFASIGNNNKAKSEAAANDRTEKMTMLETLYGDYNWLLEYYSEVGYNPSETMAKELNDASKLFIIKRASMDMIDAELSAVKTDIANMADVDFDVLGTNLDSEVEEIISVIKNNLDNMTQNVTVLKAFYRAFILPVQNDLDYRTATWPCEFNVTAEDFTEIIVNSSAIERAIDKYNQAYCAINDELYYDIFDGDFGSQYVRYAKDALIDTLFETSDQSYNLEKFRQILVRLNSRLVESGLDTGEDHD